MPRRADEDQADDSRTRDGGAGRAGDVAVPAPEHPRDDRADRAGAHARPA